MSKDNELEKEIDVDTGDSESHNMSAEDDFLIDEEEGDLSLKLKKQQEKLKVCEKERQEFLDGWQRAKADFLNVKKQSEADKAAFVLFAESALIEDLLPALTAYEAARAHKESWEAGPKDWRIGIESILSLITGALKKRGLEEINPLNETFDPLLHEAVSSKEVEKEEEDHKIVQVVGKGYKLKDKVLQPAKVVVGMFSKK